MRRVFPCHQHVEALAERLRVRAEAPVVAEVDLEGSVGGHGSTLRPLRRAGIRPERPFGSVATTDPPDAAVPDVRTPFPAYGSGMSSNGSRVIVVGYDGSATAKAAVDYAAREAGRRGRVLVVHAYGALEEEDHARALIDGLALEDDPLLETEWQADLVGGPPVDALLKAARKCGARQIVVGSHGRSLFARAALGSVSHELLQRSDVPVVVIPPVREPA